MTQHTDADTIEAGIERDRASLASTLGTLQDRMSVENLAQDALGMIRSNAAAYTQSIDNAVRANPLALALTGVGIAWLIFGSGKSSGGNSAGAKDAPRKAIARWEDEGGNVLPANRAHGAPAHGSADEDWARDLDSLRDKASARMNEIENDADKAADAVRSGLTEGLDKARDFAKERAAVLAEFVEDMKRSFADGLDDLSDAARDRIVAVRESAYAAGLRAEAAVRGSTREAGRLIEDHPMIAGGIALALGAAFAAALPRTRGEDRAFGPERDRLVKEASRLLRDERDRAARVASGVADELIDSTTAASDTISEQLSDTVEAVKKRARAEAGDEGSDAPTATVANATTGAKSKSASKSAG
jgi:ElaB/YqjD/DUF883 family membrane-anchored ribosome-binding protein